MPLDIKNLLSLSLMAKKLQPSEKFKFMTERSIPKSTKSSKKSCKTSECAIPMKRSTSPQIIAAVTVIATMMSHITILKTENIAFCIKISIGIGRNNS
jgi:L-lactate permease